MSAAIVLGRRRRLSSARLEQTDVGYEVWELGSVLAKMGESAWLLEIVGKRESGGNVAVFPDRVSDLFTCFEALHRRLSNGPVGVLGNAQTLVERIARVTQEAREASDISAWKSVCRQLADLARPIEYELRSKSVHLANIFSFSFRLRHLKGKLMFDIDSPMIKELIKETREALEKLEKGDKILASANLEMTPQNLRIIRIRLLSIERRLDKLRELAKKDPQGYVVTHTLRLPTGWGRLDSLAD